MIFLVSLYGFFIPVPSPEYEWNISCLFLPSRSLRIFRVQYFDDLSAIWTSAIWLFPVYSHFRGRRGDWVLYFVARYLDWIAKPKWNTFTCVIKLMNDTQRSHHDLEHNKKQIDVQKSEILHWAIFYWILVFEAKGRLKNKIPKQGLNKDRESSSLNYTFLMIKSRNYLFMKMFELMVTIKWPILVPNESKVSSLSSILIEILFTGYTKDWFPVIHVSLHEDLFPQNKLWLATYDVEAMNISARHS